MKGHAFLRKVPVLSKRGVERGRKEGCLEKIGAGLPALMQPYPNQLRIQAKVGDEKVFIGSTGGKNHG